jgi:hypothetical protein
MIQPGMLRHFPDKEAQAYIENGLHRHHHDNKHIEYQKA